MLRKTNSERSLGPDMWASLDPQDDEIIERLSKKDVREGEEKLMLAVLASAVECFQRYAFSKDQNGRKLFQEAEEWFLEKESNQLFSFEFICDTLGASP